MKLWEYLGKRVRVATFSGSIVTGLADIYISAEDNENEVASLILAPNENDIMREFEETEIASIEIIPTPAMASAI